MPFGTTAVINETDIAKSSRAFIAVGIAQGILLIAADYVSGMLFHPSLAAAVILLILVLSNGGFHLDGLADTFDAIAAKTDADIDSDRQKRLSIMRDGSTGPIGVTAIVFDLAFKYLLLNNLSHFTPFTYYSSLLLLPVLPKWTMVISMFHGKPARENGLGSLFIKHTGFKEVFTSTVSLFALLILLLSSFGVYALKFQYAFYAVLLITMYISCRIMIMFFNRKFGGITGDTLGAISEITEITFLFMTIAWLRLSI